jgi:ribosomal protein S18 acetylase RimI-like enzyme
MSAFVFSGGTEGLQSGDLSDFFVGWPSPPALDDRLGIVTSADEVVVCRTPDRAVVGFATAITDYRFTAYIPLVEVLPEYQGRGIGSHMVQTLLERLRCCYMIDLVCDDDVVPFYERLGGVRINAVAWRNRDRLGAVAKTD